MVSLFIMSHRQYVSLRLCTTSFMSKLYRYGSFYFFFLSLSRFFKNIVTLMNANPRYRNNNIIIYIYIIIHWIALICSGFISF